MSLKNGDLSGTILPVISLDEFEPKAGDTASTIVIAFSLTDKDPAEDLNTFIQRGFIDTLDVEVSPNTDDDGHYLVFVELERNVTFPEKFQSLIKDINNVAGKQDWKVKTYLSDDKEFDYRDPAIYKYMVIDPEQYLSKDEFMKESTQASVKHFLKDSGMISLTFEDNIVILSTGGKTIIAEMVDVGDYDTVFKRNTLSESAFKLANRPIEATVLGSMLGNYDVTPIDAYMCISTRVNDEVMLLKNTEIKYRG